MTYLFNRGGLEQDTGLIKERWGQDDSTVINGSAVRTSSAVLRTVTSNKIFYVKAISGYATGTMVLELKDTSGGSTRVRVDAVNQPYNFVFNVPLAFTTNMYAAVSGAGTSISVNYTGWEE